MEDIILITNTDFNTSAGNVSLILRRAEALFNIKQFFTNVIIYRGLKQNKIVDKEEYYSVKYIERPCDLFSFIEAKNPKYIILYGDRVLLMIKRIKSFLKKRLLNSKIILDVQSSIEEVKEYSMSLKRKLLYPIYLKSFTRALRVADYAFVVSDELKENCEKKRKGIGNIKYIKIRCGINEIESPDSIVGKRVLIRRALGIPDDDLVFVYSGYRSPWQKVDSIIHLFKSIDDMYGKAFFVFLCNNDDIFESKIRSLFPKNNYLIKMLPKEEYFDYLNACDVGFLLRDYNETNRVAFPNKFSDYLSSGLLVAINNALPEPVRLLKQYSLPYIDTDKDSIETIVEKARQKSKKLPNYLVLTSLICETELKYSSQIINNCKNL